jgi:hypothetical protein
VPPGFCRERLAACKVPTRVVVVDGLARSWVRGPTTRYRDLGPDFDTRPRPDQRKNHHIHQLEALGCTVTVSAAA